MERLRNGITSFRSGFPIRSGCQRRSMTQSICARRKVSRNAANTGSAEITSPMELSRTMRNRSSDTWFSTHAREHFARGITFGTAYNSNTNAQLPGNLAFRHGLGCVIRSLCMNIGPQISQKRFDIGLIKDNDVIHSGHGGHQFGAGGGGHDRPALPLQFFHARVGIDGHDKYVAFGAGSFQISGVASMKNIEAAIGKHNGLALFPVLSNPAQQFLYSQYFVS